MIYKENYNIYISFNFAISTPTVLHIITPPPHMSSKKIGLPVLIAWLKYLKQSCFVSEMVIGWINPLSQLYFILWGVNNNTCFGVCFRAHCYYLFEHEVVFFYINVSTRNVLCQLAWFFVFINACIGRLI